MNRKIVWIFIVTIFIISCKKNEVESNEIITIHYNPTYTNLYLPYQDYTNSYFSDTANALLLTSAATTGDAIISQKVKGSDFQPIFSIHEKNDGKLTMVNANTGYFAAGTYPIDLYKTTNGGKNWDNIYPAEGGIQNIAAPDEHTIYLMSQSMVLKSGDGGGTWQTALDQDYMNPPSVMYFYNSNIGFIVKDYFLTQDSASVLKTADGGKTWNKYSLPIYGEVRSLFFIDENRGFATTSEGGYLFGTTNGGKTWNKLGKNDFLNGNKIFFYPDGRGIIGGGNQYLYYSKDFGQTTTLLMNTGSEAAGNIFPVNDTTLIFTSGNNVYKINFSKNQ